MRAKFLRHILRAKDALPASDAEWGTRQQVEAQDTFFLAAEDAGVDVNALYGTTKLTSEEAIFDCLDRLLDLEVHDRFIAHQTRPTGEWSVWDMDKAELLGRTKTEWGARGLLAHTRAVERTASLAFIHQTLRKDAA